MGHGRGAGAEERQGPGERSLVAVGKNGERETVSSWSVPARGYGIPDAATNRREEARRWLAGLGDRVVALGSLEAKGLEYDATRLSRPPRSPTSSWPACGCSTSP
ncbi:hypothetical protein SFUMM280S_09498 [Streptomyces fumanus]